MNLVDAEKLYYEPLDKPKMIIEGLLSTGLTILSGDSKIGKSWMMLWMAIKICKGESIWGMPVSKSEVVYLTLEDTAYRIQSRMQELTDEPPQGLHFGFSCGVIGGMLEDEIIQMMKDFPNTKVLIIDTLQMVRNNASSSSNMYAKDYKDLSSLKKLADRFSICICAVHHTKKEKNPQNVFDDANGSKAMNGASDTFMVLSKESRFDDTAILSITGRDVIERQLKLKMEGNIWTVTDEINAPEIKRQRAPAFVNNLAAFMLENSFFRGTMTELLSQMGDTETAANKASAYLSRYYSDVLKPLGIMYSMERTASVREFTIWVNDDNDGNDDEMECDDISSFCEDDDSLSLPQVSSQSSQPSSDCPEMEDALAKIRRWGTSAPQGAMHI